MRIQYITLQKYNESITIAIENFTGIIIGRKRRTFPNATAYFTRYTTPTIIPQYNSTGFRTHTHTHIYIKVNITFIGTMNKAMDERDGDGGG